MTEKKTAALNTTSDFAWLTDLWSMYAPRWMWFVISALLSVSVAVLYLMSTPAIYTRTASILIKDDAKGGSSAGAASEFQDLGIFKNNTNINNELLTLKSPALMAEVVTRLGLNETYTARQGLKHVNLYKETPVMVLGAASSPTDFGFTIRLASAERCELTDFLIAGQETNDSYSLNLGDSVVTPVGTLVVSPTPFFQERWVGKSLRYAKGDVQAYTDLYLAALQASLGVKDASVITLSINDASIAKAEDILNTLIEVYNEKWVQDKNQIAISTSKFISDRLGVIERELGHVDANISSFKSQHLMPDVQAASSLFMTQSVEFKKQLQTLNIQLGIAQFIRKELNGKQITQLLPANSGISSANIEGQISEYNKLVLDRNRLVSNSSEKNPLVVDLTASLQTLKRTILQSVDNLILSLNTEIRSIRSQEEATTSQLASNPNQAKYLLSVERQQKVKEQLYLYLLQKREENELSQAFTAYNTRVINAPRGSNAPTSPLRMKILLIALGIGLVIPAALIYLLENMNNTVRGRKDLENLAVPLVGEIPLYGQAPSKLPWKKKQEPSKRPIVVKEGSRNMINEAFRVLRSNLDFMVAEAGQQNVFITTSFNPGSGKSFLCANLALGFALKGKKVLCIDGDLRHASLSTYVNSPKKGISDYLSGHVTQLQDMLVVSSMNSLVHIIPVGTVPSNPTELLENGKLAALVNSLRSEYDYIFIDCPPIDIVADTQIISQIADRTLFVIRAGLLDRTMLPVLQELYEEKRFKGFSVILNGTESTRGRYNYRYGYQYGYGDYYSQK